MLRVRRLLVPMVLLGALGAFAFSRGLGPGEERDPAPAREGAATPAADPTAGVATCQPCHAHEDEAWHASAHARHGTPRATPPGGADVAVGSTWMQAFVREDAEGYHRILPVCRDLRRDAWRDVETILDAIRGSGPGVMDVPPIDTAQRTFERDCAGCHTSGLHLGYDAVAGHFEGGWRSVAIDCEACHGPLGDHVEAGTVPHDIAAMAPRAQVALCGRCHGGPPTVGDFGPADAATWIATLADAPGQFADGRAAGQVYQVDAFVRSPCYRKGGLVCTDCHAAHRLDPAAEPEPDALCVRCHAGYAGRAHTGHALDSTGARCIACHMPRLLGGVLAHQRDHRIGIPQPGVPGTIDACTACHEEARPGWIEATWRDLWGEPDAATREATAALLEARAGAVADRRPLQEAQRHADPFFRAAATLYLGETDPVVGDPVPAVRLAAVRAAASRRDETTLRRLLGDEEPRIRGAAAAALGALGHRIPRSHREDLRVAVRHDLHDADARRLLAAFEMEAGRGPEAIALLEEVVALAPDDPRGWLTLAEAQADWQDLDAAGQSVARAVAVAGRGGAAGVGLLLQRASAWVAAGRHGLARHLLETAAREHGDPEARARFRALARRLADTGSGGR